MPTIHEVVTAHSIDLTALKNKKVPALEQRTAELERRVADLERRLAHALGERPPAPSAAVPAIDPLALIETDAEFEDVGGEG